MTRHTPTELRAKADYFYMILRNDFASMLRQAADDAEDAERYRALRSWHEAKVGKKKATVVIWGDEPWEPETGNQLDEAIDASRKETA